MTLPILTTPGASYVRAWRAEDALGPPEGIVVIPGPPYLGGQPLIPRLWNAGTETWTEGAEAGVVLAPTGIDGGPAVHATSGSSGTYVAADEALLALVEGPAAQFEVFIRCRSSYAQSFGNWCGWEAWGPNQSVNIECGIDVVTQADRGQSRSQEGTVPWTAAAYNLRLRGNSATNLETLVGAASVPDATLEWDGAIPASTMSAFATGPLQRSAADQFPPGVWTYGTYQVWWSRIVIIDRWANDVDRDNLILWLEGDEDWPEPPTTETNGLFFGSGL